MKRTALLFAALALAVVSLPAAVAAPGAATPQTPSLRVDTPSSPWLARGTLLEPRTAHIEPACADGLVYDDGSAESIVRFVDNDGNSVDADLVMRMDVGEVGKKLEQVCICWNRFDGGSTDFGHDLIFYAANGPNGSPGTLLDVLSFELDGVPPLGDSGFFDYDLSTDDIVTTTPSVYVGVRWNGGMSGGPGHAPCSDTNGGGDQPMYAANSGFNNWATLTDLFAAADPPTTPPDSLLLRLNTEEEVQTGTCPAVPCVESDTVTCLQGERFAVEVDWRIVQQGIETTGTGTPGELPLTDTDYFWFFNPNNVEMVVKVLNACSFADRFWVFAGGLTNVEVEMRVCDTETGIEQTYFNPLGTPFQPIQDTGAFATCP